MVALQGISRTGITLLKLATITKITTFPAGGNSGMPSKKTMFIWKKKFLSEGGEGVRKKEQISQPFPLFYSLVSFRGRGELVKELRNFSFHINFFFFEGIPQCHCAWQGVLGWVGGFCKAIRKEIFCSSSRQ